MRVTMFQATDGDCLLLEADGGAGSRMLIDGGRRTSWRDFTADHLGERDLDLVVVSHIDNDHISGIVELLDQSVEWRVLDIHEGRLRDALDDGADAAEVAELERVVQRLRDDLPPHPRPPTVRAVWHNGFRDQVNFDQAVPFAQSRIDELLVAAMRAQLLDADLADQLEHTANLAQGVKDAVILRNRLSDGQLGIPLNGPAAPEDLLFLADDTGGGSVGAEVLGVGGFDVRVLGPSRDDLVRLAEEWRRWVADHASVMEELRREAARESERLDTGHRPFASILANLARRLGDGSTVTAPNSASLLLLVEDDDASVLLTGDGLASEVLRGLRVHGLLAAEDDDEGDVPAHLHVDVLKVPHHGALDNIDADGFFSLVTADHYLFCGNGSHHNPEEKVVERVIEARGALRDELGPYQLWFSSSSTAANTDSRREHMAMLEGLAADVDGCTAHFLDDAFFVLEPGD